MVRERELEGLARSRLPSLLGELLGVPASDVRLAFSTGARDSGYDFAVQIGGVHLLLDVLGAVSQPRLSQRWGSVASSAKKNRVPALVVPFMTGLGRKFCAEHGINWLDLSGNADLRGASLRILVSGRPNQFPHPGRPSSVFERRSSRLVRQLLIAPGRDWSVREGAKGFEGDREIDGIRCVHPVQVYVDLKDQPERAAEASEHLKANPLLLGDSHEE